MITDYFGPHNVSLNAELPKPKPLNRTGAIVPILGIDPGGVTGWSLIALPRKVLQQPVFKQPMEMILREKVEWMHGQVDCRGKEDEGAYQLRKLIDQWPTAAVVVEDFILRAGRQEKSRDLLSPVRITAKIEHHLWLNNRKMFLQQPSLAKRLTDDRLKHMGVYTRQGGMQHARDADRHVLMFIRRCMDTKGVALQQDSWPHIFGEK
jgi:hypothetical protein